MSSPPRRITQDGTRRRNTNWRTRKELDEHLETPILRSFWARRLDLLEKDVDIQFITMLSDPD
jgi:quinol monooxygenase YgiN